jgi:hypothetical protein
MKGHMQRKKEEADARHLAERQAARLSGRPGPVGAAPPAPPVIEHVQNVGDLLAVWTAARKYLASAARYLDSVLGHCCHVEALDAQSGEAVLFVPGNQKGFANEKARAKMEEALRAVTALPVRLSLRFGEEESRPAAADNSRDGIPGPASQRVVAEVIEAVKQQRIVRELMKRLDATVTSVEMITDPQSP